MNDDQNILSLLPQGEPFIMIEKLLHSDPELTRTSLRITKENVFVEQGIFKEPGLLENNAQTAAAGAGWQAKLQHKDVEKGYIAVVKNWEIFALPVINDEIITEVTVITRILNITVIEGKTWCNDVLIARCEMNLSIDASD
jgi:hypothetical protein